MEEGKKIVPQPNNPLHGVKLQDMIEELRKEYSWEELYEMVRINCFSKNPSIKSSLTFLRKTDWARLKVEELYLDLLEERNYKK
jgi:uncharacterized protein (DUF2132 family)